MAILTRLEDFLNHNNVGYRAVTHAEAYTAQEVAAALHVQGQELAKAVMVRAHDKYVMTVLPASWKVDFGKLREVLHEKDLRLATEEEFKGLFPDCEPGAEPPFGNLYDIETIVDSSLTEDEQIYFNAGNHHDAVEMRYDDYVRLVKPKVADFAQHM